MCKDVGMEPLGDIVARIVNELAGGALGEALTPACRHGSAGGADTATILEFVPRKGPGTRGDPGQVWEDGMQTVAAHSQVKSATAGTAGLGYRVARKL